MTYSLGAQDAMAIDNGLWNIYSSKRDRLSGTELRQLYKIFKDDFFLNAMGDILRPHLSKPHGTFSQEIDLSIAWIDKRPVALMSGESHKVELADAAFFNIDVFKDARGKRVNSARCLLLQAKVAKEVAQLRQPRVPINPSSPKPDSTTERELRLLSSWPILDLYDYGASRTSLVTGVDVAATSNQTTNPIGNGWFIATPRTNPSSLGAGTPWRSPWMCGNATRSVVCDETLGGLLVRFLSSASAQGAVPEAGAKFSLDLKDLKIGNNPTCTGWDRTCVEILRAVRSDQLPEYLTGSARKPKVRSVTLHSFPAIDAVVGLFRILADFIDQFRRKKMPVLIVTRYGQE